ncbi:hypothetical protein [Pararhizobium arenae]|uniref:hypothetical protein n=1 Tax=Pararhizobium arenae TaxID=1856850 RepID=UPI00094B2D08|nr:hypothetical protein [Pararhizobium arenae]
MSRLRLVSANSPLIYLAGQHGVEGPIACVGTDVPTLSAAIDETLLARSRREGRAFYADRTEGQTGRISKYDQAVHKFSGGTPVAVYSVEAGGGGPAFDAKGLSNDPRAKLLFWIVVFDACEDLRRDIADLRHDLESEIDLIEIYDRVTSVAESADACRRYGEYGVADIDKEIDAVLNEFHLRRDVDGEVVARIDIRNIASTLINVRPGIKALHFEFSVDDGAIWSCARELVTVESDGSLSLHTEREWLRNSPGITYRQIEVIDAALWVALKHIEGIPPFGKTGGQQQTSSSVSGKAKPVALHSATSATKRGTVTKADIRRILNLFSRVDEIRCELDIMVPEMLGRGRQALGHADPDSTDTAELTATIKLLENLERNAIAELGAVATTTKDELADFIVFDSWATDGRVVKRNPKA